MSNARSPGAQGERGCGGARVLTGAEGALAGGGWVMGEGLVPGVLPGRGATHTMAEASAAAPPSRPTSAGGFYDVGNEVEVPPRVVGGCAADRRCRAVRLARERAASTLRQRQQGGGCAPHECDPDSNALQPTKSKGLGHAMEQFPARSLSSRRWRACVRSRGQFEHSEDTVLPVRCQNLQDMVVSCV